MTKEASSIQNRPLSGIAIKLIAIFTMIIDHTTQSCYKYFLIFLTRTLHLDLKSIVILQISLRGIGRIAFPLFCFLIVEGFLHTKNIKKYAMNLLIFGFISEIPFDMSVIGKITNWHHQNVFFTLFIGLTSLYLIKRYENYKPLQILITIGAMVIADITYTDYGAQGILMIIIMYIFHDNNVLKYICLAIVTYTIYLPPWGKSNDISTGLFFIMMTCISFIFMQLYNGKRGLKLNKYIFYIFYPAHLFLLGLVKMIKV